jgi:hypothetical protein
MYSAVTQFTEEYILLFPPLIIWSAFFFIIFISYSAKEAELVSGFIQLGGFLGGTGV